MKKKKKKNKKFPTAKLNFITFYNMIYYLYNLNNFFYFNIVSLMFARNLRATSSIFRAGRSIKFELPRYTAAPFHTSLPLFNSNEKIGKW